MNTESLAKLYDRLTPFERVPLIAAAASRGDEVERDRLVRSAPRTRYRLPDYHGLADALTDLSLIHATEVLQLGLFQQRLWGAVDDWEEFVLGEADQARTDRVRGMARVTAYLVCVQIDAWRLLCADLQMDPEAMLKDLRCYESMRYAEEEARLVAWTWDEANTVLARSGRETVKLPTAEGAAKSMRAFIDGRVASW
jgi:hypothetical protein